VRVHRTRGRPRRSGEPPTTSVEDTICDLVADGWGGDRLAALVTLAVQRRSTSLEGIERSIAERGRFRGVAALRDLVRDASDGAHSALEIRYLRDVERAHALPRGERQSRVRRSGHVAVRDVHYSDFRLTIELDGKRHHDTFESRLRDARRDRLAAADGDLTLRFGWWDVASTACVVARELAVVLRARGWTGRARTCRKCGESGPR
jgi:very-short-patch-repair endonuclease